MLIHRRHVAFAVLVTVAGAALYASSHRQRIAAVLTQPPLNAAQKMVVLRPASNVASRDENAIRDLDIVFYHGRVESDPQSATDRSTLAALYLERARATGGFSDYALAEAAARRSLALRTEHNAQTYSLLVSALLARHAFPEALRIARAAHAFDPESPSQLAMLGEIELELGAYDSAETHFQSVKYDGQSLSVGARIARWKELTGHSDAARQVLLACIRRLGGREDLPREQRAWFHYRLAELDLRTGRFAAADSAFQRGLAIFPDDYRILGGLAQLSLLRGEWRNAIEYGDRATAVQLDPTVLGIVSDAYRQLGDSAAASQYAQAMTTSALQQPGSIHRAWGLFALDHGSAADRQDVLTRARADLRTRRDVYGFDLLAWALFKQGRTAQAREPMLRALSQHTEDPQLFEHASAIEAATGTRRKPKTIASTPGCCAAVDQIKPAILAICTSAVVSRAPSRCTMLLR